LKEEDLHESVNPPLTASSFARFCSDFRENFWFHRLFGWREDEGK